jgi:hypothetical protein
MSVLTQDHSTSNEHFRTTLEQAVRNGTFGKVHNLTVAVHNDRAIVEGHTGTYYTKQLAQQAMRNVLGGGMVIENGIEVRKR